MVVFISHVWDVGFDVVDVGEDYASTNPCFEVEEHVNIVKELQTDFGNVSATSHVKDGTMR